MGNGRWVLDCSASPSLWAGALTGGADSRAGTTQGDSVVLSLPFRTMRCGRKSTGPGVVDLALTSPLPFSGLHVHAYLMGIGLAGGDILCSLMWQGLH